MMMMMMMMVIRVTYASYFLCCRFLSSFIAQLEAVSIAAKTDSCACHCLRLSYRKEIQSGFVSSIFLKLGWLVGKQIYTYFSAPVNIVIPM